jgi:fumarate reductase subunit D
MLLSGLVLPGAGQWVLGRRLRSALIVCWVLLLLLALFVRLLLLVYTMMVPAGDLTRMQISPELISRIHKQAYGDNWWLLLIIAALWIGSVVDAYLISKKMEGGQNLSG